MYLITHWRLLVGVLALACVPLVYMKGRTDGQRLERLAVAAAQLEANDNAREVERLRQRSVDTALGDAAARQSRILADAASARGDVERMRDTLDAVERASKESSQAAGKSIAALRAVFQDCSRRYQELAEVADRHASDSLMFQDAWPK